MQKNYLMYWRWDTVEYNLGSPLNHAAGEQLSKVNVGDTLWIVTIKSGELFLAGTIKIGWVGNYIQAAKRLKTFDLWDSKWHVIAHLEEISIVQLINISNIASHLRFESRAGKDRLDITEGRADPQQLQSMRLLKSESVQLLQFAWRQVETLPSDTLEYLETTEDEIAFEGYIVERTRQERHRNHELVQEAKSRFLQKHGRLFCEVCGFDFAEIYGNELGEHYIEAHHTHPLADRGEHGSDTTIDSLVMLCANCHRMVHRYSIPLKIESLKQIIDSQRRKTK